MGTVKRLRIAELERQRLERLAAGEDVPSILRKPEEQHIWVMCGKCKHAMTQNLVDAHLAECQPNGATCAKCNQLIKSDFIAHLLSCTGKPKEPDNVVVEKHEPQGLELPEFKG